ncbi:MAG: BON domain-containing protein [Rickettsiella sp.]|nr:BON domain-containing protein [Rickettsiella sp.]
MKAKLFIILSLMVFPIVGTMAMGSHKAITNETTGQYVDNSVITLKAKSKLLADPELKSLAISVMSYKGQVKLTGFVDTEAQKIKAGKLVKQVEGVTAVTNALVVKKMTK